MMLLLRLAAIPRVGSGSLKTRHNRAARKSRDTSVKSFDPLRRNPLCLLDQLTLGESSRQSGHNVNVISNTADADEIGSEVTADCGQITVNPRPKGEF
jgi:hypothetical protein